MNVPRSVKIETTLKTFSQPDTRSEEEGYAQPGEYPVLEYLENIETDYAKIKNPELGEVWICTRWNKTTYGEVSTQTKKADGPEPDTSQQSVPTESEKVDPILDTLTAEEEIPDESLVISISEDALVSLLDDFQEFTYDLHNPTYPFPLEGVNLPLAPPNQNNCCTFVEALVIKAFESEYQLPWDSKRHGQMMINSAEDYFSPITCLVDLQLATTVPETSPPAPWTIIQGWRKMWGGGHTFIILDHHKATDRVLTLESNKAYELDGVGFRKIGNYGVVGNPGPNWWKNSDLFTWERIKSTYPFRRHCQLHVDDIHWIEDGLSNA